MATKRLFVGNLNWKTDIASLKEAFSEFGEVKDAKIITDRETGQSRGFGFVEFVEAEAAANAITQMHGQALEGRNLIVNEAEDRRAGGGGGSRPSSSGGYPPRDPPRDFGSPPPLNGPPPGGRGGKSGRGSKRGGRDRDDDRW
jgi:RNA recognition motif-containing protein